MLAIRFARVGRKNRTQFKVVLQDHVVAPGGRHVAVLGSYDPCKKVSVLQTDKIKEWLTKGAQASDSVFNLLIKEGIITGKKRAIKMKRPAVKEEAKTETPAEKPVQVEAIEEKKEEPARDASPSDAGGVKAETVVTQQVIEQPINPEKIAEEVKAPEEVPAKAEQ